MPEPSNSEPDYFLPLTYITERYFNELGGLTRISTSSTPTSSSSDYLPDAVDDIDDYISDDFDSDSDDSEEGGGESLDYPYEWCNGVFRWDANVLDVKKIKLNSNNLYYGSELEFLFDVNTRREYQALVDSIIETVGNESILVHDGSFRDYGCGAEIVTVPMGFKESLDFARKLFSSPAAEKLRKAPLTGMHVHVSKKAFSLLQQTKISKLVYNNPAFFLSVTKKDNERYCSYSLCSVKETARFYYSNKYVAVNFSNPNTIEFRFFTVPLTYTGYKERLFFIKAILDFCTSASYADIQLPKFTEYCKDRVNLQNLGNY